MSVLKGMMLATVNVMVIACGLGLVDNHLGTSIFVIMFGGIPGVLTGAILGGLGGLTARLSPLWRVPLLSFPAFGLVIALAASSGMDPAVPVACIPTFLASLVLERWTRRVAPPPPVPVATVHSMR